jgi:hypothetical protein
LIPALEKNLKLTHLENLSDTEANKYKVYMAITEALAHYHLPHKRTMTVRFRNNLIAWKFLSI